MGPGGVHSKARSDVFSCFFIIYSFGLAPDPPTVQTTVTPSSVFINVTVSNPSDYFSLGTICMGITNIQPKMEQCLTPDGVAGTQSKSHTFTGLQSGTLYTVEGWAINTQNLPSNKTTKTVTTPFPGKDVYETHFGGFPEEYYGVALQVYIGVLAQGFC